MRRDPPALASPVCGISALARFADLRESFPIALGKICIDTYSSAGVHLSSSSPSSSFSSTTFSLSRFAEVVSVNRLPAIRDQPTKETIDQSFTSVGDFKFCLPHPYASFSRYLFSSFLVAFYYYP